MFAFLPGVGLENAAVLTVQIVYNYSQQPVSLPWHKHRIQGEMVSLKLLGDFVTSGQG